jgi:hypothetical protein
MLLSVGEAVTVAIKVEEAPDHGSSAGAGGSRGLPAPSNHGARATESSRRGRAGRREVAARSRPTRRRRAGGRRRDDLSTEEQADLRRDAPDELVPDEHNLVERLGHLADGGRDATAKLVVREHDDAETK